MPRTSLIDKIRDKFFLWLLYGLTIGILVAYLSELLNPQPVPPPTAAERASEYRTRYESGMRSCKYDYRTEEQLKLEQGWTYEKCARVRAEVGMYYWEKYR